MSLGMIADGRAEINGEDELVIRRTGENCSLDPNCINRLHPAIPPIARAKQGQTIVFETRNAGDLDMVLGTGEPRPGTPPDRAVVHPLSGPVYIEGAMAGDVLAIELVFVQPGNFGYTILSPIGLLADHFQGADLRAIWKLTDEVATTDAIPGVRIPKGAFPGVVTVLPSSEELGTILRREQELLEVGGAVLPPSAVGALPSSVCGPEGAHSDECLRTIPPREHGGNTDIRFFQAGSTIYIPCQIDGCGLAIGDVHFAQGDAEVAGTAIEMDSSVTVRTRVLKGGPSIRRGPHFEGGRELLDIPSARFYATTGFPFKDKGQVPSYLKYLKSDRVAPLRNLSKDLMLASQNALLEMIEYMVWRYGLTREQAYIVASVAVDLRIAQVVDAPNVGVSAILPVDIFVD